MVELLIERAQDSVLMDGLVEITPDPELFEGVVEEEGRSNKTFYVDSEYFTQLFVKVTDGPSPEGYIEPPAMQEMEVAQVVREVTSSAVMQQVGQTHSFASVAFVEPMLATTNLTTGAKTVVFPWKTGRTIETSSSTGETTDIHALVADLTAVYAASGIHAEDLSSAQLLVFTDDAGTHLRIIDAERYTLTGDAAVASSEASRAQEWQSDWSQPESLRVYTSPQGEIAVNMEHTNRPMAQAVAEWMARGAPLDDFTEIRPDAYWLPDEPGDVITHRFYVNNTESPTAFIKKEDAVPQREPQEARNDILMAQQVAAILASEEGQRIATSSGFASISHGAPLAVYVNAATGEKTSVFTWQDGHIINELPANDPRTAPQEGRIYGDDFIDDLYDLFARHNINAGDLSAAQIMVHRDRQGAAHMYLIDTEQYTYIRTDAAAEFRDDMRLVARLQELAQQAEAETPDTESISRRDIPQHATMLLDLLQTATQGWTVIYSGRSETGGRVQRLSKSAVIPGIGSVFFEVSLSYHFGGGLAPATGNLTMRTPDREYFADMLAHPHSPRRPRISYDDDYAGQYTSDGRPIVNRMHSFRQVARLIGLAHDVASLEDNP
jgi:hypothetical protein